MLMRRRTLDRLFPKTHGVQAVRQIRDAHRHLAHLCCALCRVTESAGPEREVGKERTSSDAAESPVCFERTLFGYADEVQQLWQGKKGFEDLR